MRAVLQSDRGSGGLRMTWEARLIPIGEDFLRFHHLLFGSGEIEPQFSCLAGDLYLDGVQTVAFHASAQLFVGFVEAMFLEAIAHG